MPSGVGFFRTAMLPTIVADGCNLRRLTGRWRGTAALVRRSGGCHDRPQGGQRSGFRCGDRRLERGIVEPGVGAQVAAGLGVDPGRQAGLVGHEPFQHEPLRLSQVEPVPTAELECDLLGGVGVDQQVDRAQPFVVGALAHHDSVP